MIWVGKIEREMDRLTDLGNDRYRLLPIIFEKKQKEKLELLVVVVQLCTSASFDRELDGLECNTQDE